MQSRNSLPDPVSSPSGEVAVFPGRDRRVGEGRDQVPDAPHLAFAMGGDDPVGQVDRDDSGSALLLIPTLVIFLGTAVIGNQSAFILRRRAARRGRDAARSDRHDLP